MDEETEVRIVEIGKASYWLFPDGRMRGVIQGGATDDDEEDDDETDDEEDDDDESESSTKKKQPKPISQRQMKAIAAREKRAGRKAGQASLAKELGYDSVEDMKEALARSEDDDEEDEEPAPTAKKKAAEPVKAPARKAPNKDKERADRLQAELDQERFSNKVERLLLSEDALASKASKAVALLELELDADDDEILEAIDKLRDELPEIFHSDSSDDGDEEGDEPGHVTRKRTNARRRTATGASGTRRPPDSNTGSRKKTRKAAPPKERASTRLAERHPEFAKKS